MNELNVGAKSRGERLWREEVELGVGGGFDWVYVSGWVVVRMASVPKREYSGPEVLKSGSRSGTDASAETVRLWTSVRLLKVVEVTSLEDEPSSACLFLRLEARRRARGTIMRMRATMKRIPPIAATMMMASLFLGDEWGVEGEVAVC